MVWLAMAGSLLWGAGAQAGPTAADEQRVEDIKGKILDRLVMDARRRQDQDCPPGTSAEIFAGSEMTGLTSLELTVAVGGLEPLHRILSARELQALGHGDLARLGCMVLPEGEQAVQALLSFGQGGPGTTRASVQADGTIGVPHDHAPLIVMLDKPQPWSAPRVRLDQPEAATERGGLWSALKRLFGAQHPQDLDGKRRYLPGAPSDPHVRFAHFLDRTQGSLSQLVELKLLGLADPVPETRLYRMELAAADLAYGLSGESEDLLREDYDRDPHAVDRDSIGLDLAAYCYARGDFDRSAEVLALIRTALARTDLARWQDLHARVLVAQGRYVEAIGALKAVPDLGDYAARVRYYDLGVSLVRSGSVGQGLTVLNRVGSVLTQDPSLLALSDRANLILANHFLLTDQSASAIPLYERIGSGGMYANAALVGLGWAWLAPPGARQPEVAVGDEIVTGLPPEAATIPGNREGDQNQYRRFDVSFFEFVPVPGTNDARLKRALVAWTALVDRDPADPAVAKAELSIAYALRKLGARAEAIAHDERAVALADDDLRGIERAFALVGSAGWFDQLLPDPTAGEPDPAWEDMRLPDSRLARDLEDVFAEAAFQAHLRNYRDLRILKSALRRSTSTSIASMTEAPGAGLDELLEAALTQQHEFLVNELQEPLQQQIGRIRQLLIEGRSALTQEYDRPHAQ